MALVVGGAVAGAVSAFSAAAGTAIATGTALAAGTATAVAIGAGIGAVLGGVQQIEADLRAEEVRKKLNAEKRDTSRNITASSSPSPYVYGERRVGGVLTFLNAGKVRLVDWTSYRGRTPLEAEWGDAQFRRYTNGNLVPTTGAETTSRSIIGRPSTGGFFPSPPNRIVHDNVLPSRRPYMSLALILSDGPIGRINEVYIDGQHVPTTRYELSGRSTRGSRLLKSGSVLVPQSYPVPNTNDIDTEYYPEWEAASNFWTEDYGRGVLFRTWPLFQIFEYFKADGTEGFSLFNATDSIENDNNNEQLIRMRQHRDTTTGKITNWMNGWSWVHIYMDSMPQASGLNYYDSPADAAEDPNGRAFTDLSVERAFSNIPRFEFLVNGSLISPAFAIEHMPESYSGAWHNPAVVAYDYLTRVQGFSDDEIDKPTLQESVTHCAEKVRIDVGEWKRNNGSRIMWEQYSKQSYDNDGSIAETDRYRFDGVIYGGESSENVLSELAFAMQGTISQSGGKFYIRAGKNRPATSTITPDLIVQGSEWTIQSTPSLQDRVNALDMGLQQSKVTRTINPMPRTDGIGDPFYPLYLATTLKRRINPSAQVRDGGELFLKDLGERRFVTDPLIAQRLMAIQLRRFESNKTYSTRIRAGDNLEWLSLKQGEIVSINDPAAGPPVPLAVVVSREILPDLTIAVKLQELRTSNGIAIYDDTLDLPPVENPTLVHPVTEAPISAGDLGVTRADIARKADATDVIVFGQRIEALENVDFAFVRNDWNEVQSTVNRLEAYLQPFVRVNWKTSANAMTFRAIYDALDRAMRVNLKVPKSTVYWSVARDRKLATGFYRPLANSDAVPITHLVRGQRGITVMSGIDPIFTATPTRSGRPSYEFMQIVA